MKTQISFVSAAVLALLAASGCRKEEPQNPSQFQGGTQQGWQPGAQPGGPPGGQPPPSPYGPGPAAGPGAAPPPAAPPPGPAPGPAPAAGGGCDAATAAMLAPVLTPLQQQQAPGAKAVASICGMTQTGQVLEVAVTLQPGKCYTGIGGGLPPLTQLDLELQAAAPIPGAPPLTLAVSAAGGGIQPVLGGKPNCFKNPFPIPGPAKFRLKITGGSGPAIATIYEK